ncbi:MAG: leucine-rich repeat protein [Clostridia bacterium]|nr:leucine-rich repeat protein [Clostridia bacterium]
MDCFINVKGGAADTIDSLQEIHIPDGVTDLNYALFRQCDSLRSMTLPRSVKVINANAFSGCKTFLTSITPEQKRIDHSYPFKAILLQKIRPFSKGRIFGVSYRNHRHGRCCGCCTCQILYIGINYKGYPQCAPCATYRLPTLHFVPLSCPVKTGKKIIKKCRKTLAFFERL